MENTISKVTNREVLVTDIPSLFVSFILRNLITETSTLYIGFPSKSKLLILTNSSQVYVDLTLKPEYATIFSNGTKMIICNENADIAIFSL
jgi:hypothetical protein